MYLWDLDTQVKYQQELIKQAEQDRLAREAIQFQRKGRPALGWVGRNLMVVGARLVRISGQEAGENGETVYNGGIRAS
ncbi:MAG: hypothetical protein GYB67_01585 [Chloroflexi bacterium]|nr:hypothetical protein [Chloroflexota bacterium]